MPQLFSGGGVVGSAQITDGAIVNADVNASAAIAASKLTGLPYQQLDLVTLGGAATTLPSNTFTAKKHLRLIIYVAGNAGGADLKIRFNGDSGANYNWSTGIDQAAPTVSSGDTGIKFTSGALTTERTIIVDIYNVSAIKKYVRFVQITPTGIAEGQGHWTSVAAQITQATLYLDAAGNISTGTEITVLGMD